MKIIKSYSEPNKTDIWFNKKDNKHYYFNNGKWRLLNNLEEFLEDVLKVTYSKLKELRDNSQLNPGTTYRITDYNCTTSLTNTTSAGHQFDILVTADDVNVLNENAHAIQHDGADTYFDNSDLSAWELKYCLDNDTSRFAWAVTGSTGRGVIYYMKDEWNNECPYDFKNIQYQRYAMNTGATSATTVILTNANNETRSKSIYNSILDKKTVSSYKYNAAQYTLREWVNDKGFDGAEDNFTEEDYDFDQVYIGFGDINYDNCGVDVLWPVTNELVNIYTFSSDNTQTDLSLNGYSNSVYNNSMLSYVEGNKQQLNVNVFFGFSNRSNVIMNNCYSNTFGNSCYSNTFGNECYSNTFGNECNNNTFGNDCYYNTFGNDCYSNTFGNSCSRNTIGNYCYYNTFGNDCYYNTFGNYFQYNTFGNDCYSNTFGNDCYSNTFGNGCYSNTFENGCYYNTFGNSCSSNTFGNGCYSNTFGNSCSRNTIGNSCYYNTFGNDYYSNTFGYGCYSNTFGNYCYSNTFGNYFQYNTCDEGIKNLKFTTNYSVANNNILRYLHILNGYAYSSLTPVPTGITMHAEYPQFIGFNSSKTFTVKLPLN